MNFLLTPIYRSFGKTAIWDITSKCNLHCKHCYQSYENGIKEFTKKDINLIIKKLVELQVNHIHLLGGEPLSYRYICYVIKMAKENNICVTLNTNGTLLTPKLAKELKSLDIDLVAFSMDGATDVINDSIRGKNVLKQVKKAIDIATEENLNISICYTISNYNYKDFENIIIYCLQKKIKALRIIPVYSYSSARKNGMDCIDYNLILNEVDAVINKHIHQIKRIGLRFNCDFRLKVLEYFNRKYDNIFDCDLGGLVCNPGRDYFVIKADASIVPCIGYSNIENGQIKQDNIFDVVCIETNNSSISVKNYRDKVFAQNYFEYCKKCYLFNKSCTPCPFYNVESIEQCVWADNKFYNRNMQVLHTKYKLYSNCTIGENFITNSFGEKFLVNRFLIDFLYEINHCNKTIIQIIEDSIVEQLDENCELEIADAIDYLYCHHILKKKKEEY